MAYSVGEPCGGVSYFTAPNRITPGTVVLLSLDTNKYAPNYLDIWWHDGETVATIESRVEIPGLGLVKDYRRAWTIDPAGRHVELDFFRYWVAREDLKWVHECPNPSAHGVRARV